MREARVIEWDFPGGQGLRLCVSTTGVTDWILIWELDPACCMAKKKKKVMEKLLENQGDAPRSPRVGTDMSVASSGLEEAVSGTFLAWPLRSILPGAQFYPCSGNGIM